MSFFIGRAMLRSSSKRSDPARDPSSPRVDRRHLLIAAIGREHTAGLVVEHDEIRILANRHFGDFPERFEIEDHDRSGVALTDEPPTELRRYRGAMHIR